MCQTGNYEGQKYFAEEKFLVSSIPRNPTNTFLLKVYFYQDLLLFLVSLKLWAFVSSDSKFRKNQNLKAVAVSDNYFYALSHASVICFFPAELQAKLCKRYYYTQKRNVE